MKKDIKQKIKDRIAVLPIFNQLAFGVMVTERFLPNYFAFYIIEKWGNPMILLNGIDLLKNIIRQENYEPEELELVDSLSHTLSAKELEEYFYKDELTQQEIAYQLQLLEELRNLKISHRVYIEKSMKAPLLKY